VKVWSATNGKELHAKTVNEGGVSDLAFTNDGKVLVFVSDDDGAKAWNLTKQSVSVITKDEARSLALSPDGKTIACGSFQGVKFYDFMSGRELTTLKIGFTPFDDNPGQLYLGVTGAVAYSPDGNRLASADYKVRIWDIAVAANAKQLFMLGEVKEKVRNSISFVAFTPDAKHVISVHEDGGIRFWDSTTGKLVRTLQGRIKSITSGAMTSDGKRLVCGSSDKKVVLWDVVAGKELQTFTADGEVWSVAISPDGARVAADGAEQVVWIWETVDNIEKK
jgi:WD40 repeat protein